MREEVAVMVKAESASRAGSHDESKAGAPDYDPGSGVSDEAVMRAKARAHWPVSRTEETSDPNASTPAAKSAMRTHAVLRH